MITTNVYNCFNCHAKDSIITDFSSGQINCTLCGVVIEDRIIDEGMEWRNFSTETPGSGTTDHNRVGGPMNPYLDEISLSLKIQTKNNKGPLSRFRQRAFESGNRSILRGIEKIEELAIKLELLMAIVDKSKDVYKTVIDNKKLKGRSIEGIIAAIFYHVCRQNNANRSLMEIVTRLKIDRREFVRCFKSIESLIKSSTDRDTIENTVNLTNNYCNKLNYEVKFKTTAKAITKEVCGRELLAGRNPNTVSGACILFTGLLYKMQIIKKDLSSIANICESTILSAFQVIMENKNDCTPNEYKHLLENLK